MLYIPTVESKSSENVAKLKYMRRVLTDQITFTKELSAD